ncbi:hypothetical protein P3X46_019238 [Hevea brasiliensis]|uniref:Peptidase A1 domain-containing protein n=1 Tax=Hevea brasiliensis TaxID=3981 RepID=A0ABQ9LI29_HEVBR|nr:aspartyl protease family protein At5g10770 [Hevea brasiliensis]KAJ9167621.1 hypothetical protein P3X46_019238 [Hevea brasiliensis]
MAIRSFLCYFLVFLFWHLNELRVYGAKEVINHLNASPPPVSKCSASPHGFAGGSQGLRVTYKGGPCSPLGNPRQILILDQSRVDSINSFNSKTYVLSDLKATNLDSSIKGSPLDAGVFFVQVGFGTPQQNFDLLLDTGSNTTWVQSKPCSTCKNGNKIFHPSASSTFSNHSCIIPPGESHYKIYYGDHSYSEGYYGCDTITMSRTLVYPNFRFGCGQNPNEKFSGASGVLGLTSDGDAMKSFGKIFCYCLPPKEHSQGYLHFERDAQSKCRTDKSIRLLAKRYYFVNLIGISVGHIRLEISSSFPSHPSTIIDSGTVITRLPSSIYTQLSSSFNKFMSQYPPAKAVETLDTCYNLEGFKNPTIPQVVLHFENSNDITLDTDTVLYKGDEDTVFCLAFAAKGKQSDLNIIGSHQQRKLNILYDLQNGKLGFGMGNCNH